MRTGENSSTDWVSIGDAVSKTLKPIRQIAREHGVSDTAVRKEMKKRGWARPQAAIAECEPPREPSREAQIEASSRTLAAATVPELTGRGRNIILDLMAELEFLNRYHQTLSDMVTDYVNGEKDSGIRAKLMKALDHETRSKTANYLATALAKLNDAAPGKKEQAQEAANTAGQGSDWEGDLDFSGTRPN